MNKPVYECRYCGNQQNTPGRCQHGRAQVEMRKRHFPVGSRGDSLAGKKAAFNPNRED